MDSYAKVFGSIIHSTVWQEPMATRIVWITMLVISDQDGLVAASVGGLARAANVTREECEAALESFTSPDPDSKTTSNEGRRIARVEGGWILLNYDKYRDLKSPEDVREKNAARQKRWRERRNVTLRNVTVDAVTHSGSGSGSGEDQGESDPPGCDGPDLEASEPGCCPEAEAHAASPWKPPTPPAPASEPPPVNRGDPDAPRTADGLLNLFSRLWGAAKGIPWYGRPRASRLATQFMDRPPAELAAMAPEILLRLRRFLSSTKPFYVQRKHAFELFIADFDALAAPQARGSPAHPLKPEERTPGIRRL